MSDRTSNLKGIENGRAEFAFLCAKEAKDKFKKNASDYKSYAKNIPMMIKTNGLGATLAFILSKSKDKAENGKYSKGQSYMLIYEQVKEWLNSDQKKYLLEKADEKENELVNKVISLESTPYRAVTIEVLALFNWLRRFADGLIEDKKEDKGKTSEQKEE